MTGSLMPRAATHAWRRLARLAGTILIAALLAAALDAGTGAARSLAVAAVPTHLSQDWSRFLIYSNSAWGIGLQGRPAREVALLQKAPPPSEPLQAGRERYAAVWAPTCLPGRQTVSFVRRVVLPGRPARLAVSMSAALGGWPGAFDSAVLLVNGHRVWVAHLRGGSDRADTGETNPLTHLDAGALKAFGLGANTLEVRVTKNRSPKSVPRCNSGTSQSRLGLLFIVSGSFEADLAVATGYPATDRQTLARPGAKLLITYSITNHGPSAVHSGEFTIRFSSSFERLVVYTMEASGPGAGKCAEQAPSPASATVTCPFTDVPAGGKPTVKLTLLAMTGETLPESGGAFVRFDWGASGETTDPNLSNNEGHASIYYCTADATDPACAQ